MNFVYTSYYFLGKLFGLDSSSIDAFRKRLILTDIAGRINSITGQYFNPNAATLYADGRSDNIVNTPGFIPIIKLDNLTVIGNRTNYRDTPITGLNLLSRSWNTIQDFGGASCSCSQADCAYTEDDYVISNQFDKRVIELAQRIFPGGAQNVKMEGVFGWLENVREVSFILVDEITSTSEEV